MNVIIKVRISETFVYKSNDKDMLKNNDKHTVTSCTEVIYYFT